MHTDEAMIIEEIVDPLILGGLFESRPSVAFVRLSPGSVRLDLGEPNEVFILTVEQEQWR